jgi:hypothetical protein
MPRTEIREKDEMLSIRELSEKLIGSSRYGFVSCILYLRRFSNPEVRQDLGRK